MRIIPLLRQGDFFAFLGEFLKKYMDKAGDLCYNSMIDKVGDSVPLWKGGWRFEDSESVPRFLGL